MVAQCLFDLRLQTGRGDVLGYPIQKVAGDGERLLESVLRLEGKGEVVVARDMARLTGVSLRTVRRWIANEIVASRKLGGARLVAKSELERACCRLVARWT